VLCDVINTLLTEDDFCSTLDNFVNDGLNHPLFFIKECLELVRAGDIDLSVHFGFLELDSGVEEHDFSLGDFFRHARVNTFLVNDHAENDLGIFD